MRAVDSRVSRCRTPNLYFFIYTVKIHNHYVCILGLVVFLEFVYFRLFYTPVQDRLTNCFPPNHRENGISNPNRVFNPPSCTQSSPSISSHSKSIHQTAVPHQQPTTRTIQPPPRSIRSGIDTSTIGRSNISNTRVQYLHTRAARCRKSCGRRVAPPNQGHNRHLSKRRQPLRGRRHRRGGRLLFRL